MSNGGSSELAFAKEQLKRACKAHPKYPADHVPREGTLLKRKHLLPVPASCLAADADPANHTRTARSDAAATAVLTVKTLSGQAYKLHIDIQASTGAQLHVEARRLCGVQPSSTVRLLRQGRVVPDSDAELSAFIADPSVPLNLIEQQKRAEQGGKDAVLTDNFFKDLDVLLGKHVSDAAVRERIKKGFKASCEQWTQ